MKRSTGARMGRVLSGEMHKSRAPAIIRCGRQHVRHRHREMMYGPARSETPCTCGTSLRENREIYELLGAMVRRAALERP